MDVSHDAGDAPGHAPNPNEHFAPVMSVASANIDAVATMKPALAAAEKQTVPLSLFDSKSSAHAGSDAGSSPASKNTAISSSSGLETGLRDVGSGMLQWVENNPGASAKDFAEGAVAGFIGMGALQAANLGLAALTGPAAPLAFAALNGLEIAAGAGAVAVQTYKTYEQNKSSFQTLGNPQATPDQIKQAEISLKQTGTELAPNLITGAGMLAGGAFEAKTLGSGLVTAVKDGFKPAGSTAAGEFAGVSYTEMTNGNLLFKASPDIPSANWPVLAEDLATKMKTPVQVAAPDGKQFLFPPHGRIFNGQPEVLTNEPVTGVSGKTIIGPRWTPTRHEVTKSFGLPSMKKS